jgi:hypothetical protein
MVVTFLQWLCRSRTMHVSMEWLASQRRQDSRVEFHGVFWRWPVNQAHDQAREWTKASLKRLAA